MTTSNKEYDDDDGGGGELHSYRYSVSQVSG